MYKTAILVATHNGERWLKEQLISILSQKKAEITLFVSDDISSDQSVNIVRNIVQENQNTLLLTANVVFGSAAQNFFRLIRDVNLEQFSYVALSDQDDIWLPEKLELAINKIDGHGVDGYSSNVMAFWPDGRKKIINKSQPQREFDYMFESAGPGCTFVLRQKLALELQRWLRDHKEETKQISLHDWFIYAFSRSRGYKWFIDNQYHMLYRQHEKNVVGANVGIKAKFSRWQKLREGWLRTQALLIADLLDYQDAWPIERMRSYRFYDRLILIMHINKFRRRFRDRIGFALFLLFPLKR